MAISIRQFPAQKKLLSQKTEAWGIENIEACITITNSDTSKIRKKRREKKINYDLINGIIDETDIDKAFNPMGIKGVAFPAKTQNYPIELGKFNVLKGEEAKRRFDWKLRSVNQDVISQKEFMMGQDVYQALTSELTTSNYSEELAGRRLKQLEHYHKYEFQDYGEVMGTRILDYFWYTQKMKTLFSDTFYDVLVAAEEIYSCDIVHGEPEISKRSPLNISTFGSGDSFKIEDSDIIVDDGYLPVGKIIDQFWDVLTDSEVDKLEDIGRRGSLNLGKVWPGPTDVNQESQLMTNSQLITVDGVDDTLFGGFTDYNGCIRVTRTLWRSRRKIGGLKYFDPNGDEQQTIIDEKFPLEQFKHLGWTADWFWINEWWQGYKIGADMYKRIEALPRIGSKMSNPSICLPPIVGTIYAIGSGPSVSLMDRVKPYKYLYNVYMKRTELSSARNKGVIAELDLAEIPDDWDEEMVMMFAEANGYMVTDSFKEGKKGQAQGKLVSTIKQRGNSVLNLNSSDVIRANLELARYVKLELGEIAGVTPQREGQIDNRETLGGVNRSVTQSSHITEEWFRVHDNTKIRAMELTLETAKFAWKNLEGDGMKKLQYVDDGLITHMFNVDTRAFAESEYGYYISDGQNDTELIQSIKMLAQAALQNDKATFKDIFTIYRDSSVSSMIRKLEDSEERKMQRDDDIRKETIEDNEKQRQALVNIEQMKIEQQDRIALKKIEADVYKAELGVQAKMMEIESAILNTNDKAQYDHEMDKLKEELKMRKQELESKSKDFHDELKRKEKETKDEIASKEKIARMKPKPSKV